LATASSNTGKNREAIEKYKNEKVLGTCFLSYLQTPIFSIIFLFYKTRDSCKDSKRFKEIQRDSKRFKEIQRDAKRFKEIQRDSKRFKECTQNNLIVNYIFCICFIKS
jgi:amino acid permease